MDTVSNQVPDIDTEIADEPIGTETAEENQIADEPMEISTSTSEEQSEETAKTHEEEQMTCEEDQSKAGETKKDTDKSEVSETRSEITSESNSDEVNLIPIEDNPKQAKLPSSRKRRRPPQQLVLLPSMSIPEALRTLNYNLKLSLVIGFQDTALALRLLKDLMDLNFTSSDIEQVKDLVATLRKVRHFKHNSRIRNRAEDLYTKIKSLYVIGEVRSVNKHNAKHKPSLLIMKINEGMKPTPNKISEGDDHTNPVDQQSRVKDEEKSPIDQESTIKDKENQKPATQPVRRSLRNRNKTAGGSSEKDQVVPSSSQ